MEGWAKRSSPLNISRTMRIALPSTADIAGSNVVEDLRRVDAASDPSASAPVEPDIPSLPLAEFPEDDDAGLRDFFV